MVAALRDVQRPLLDAGLNLIWPGLGQLHQGRIVAAVAFGLSTAGLAAALLAWPPERAVAGVALLAVTVWSIYDTTR